MEASTHKIEIESLLKHAAWLERLARTLVHDAQAADDLVQNTWEAAVKAPPRSNSNPKSWLSRVLHNQLFQNHRSKTRRDLRESIVAEKQRSVVPADEEVARAEMGRLLVSCVLKLEEPFRTTILLRYQSDLNPKEIARRMDVPEATVRSRTKRGLKKIRMQLPHDVGLDWVKGFGVWAPGLALRRTWPITAKAKVGITTIGLSFAILASALYFLNHEETLLEGAIVEAPLIFHENGTVPANPANPANPADPADPADQVESQSIERINHTSFSEPISIPQTNGYFINGQCLAQENQSPIVGCEVKIFANDSDYRKTVQTDQEGRFSFSIENLDKGKNLSLSINKPDRVQRNAVWSAKRDYATSRNFGTIQLQKGAIVSGILRGKNQQPIPEAFIQFSDLYGYGILDPTQMSSSYAKTDAAGAFTLNSGLPIGLWPFTIRAKGHLLAEGTALEVTSDTAPIHLEPTLIPVPSISGQLLGADGSPIYRAYLWAKTGHGKIASARTDEAGFFQIYPRYLNTPPVALQVEAKGYLRFTTEVLEWGSKNLALTAQSASSILIRVIDSETKEPIEAYSVICYADDGLEERSSDTNMPRHLGNHADGQLRVQEMRPMDSWLMVIPKDISLQRVGPIRVNPLELNGQVLEIQVKRMKAVQVLVQSMDGKPVSSSHVSLCDDLPKSPHYIVWGKRYSTQSQLNNFGRVPSVYSDGKTNSKGEVSLSHPNNAENVYILIEGEHESLAVPFLIHNETDYISTYQVKAGGKVSGRLISNEKMHGKLGLEFKYRNPDRTRITFGAKENVVIPNADGFFEQEFKRGIYDIFLLIPNASQSGSSWGGGWSQIPGKLDTIEMGDDDITDLLFDVTDFLPVRISGIALMDGKPITEGAIHIRHFGDGAITSTERGRELPDINGRFDLSFLPPGKYEIQYQGVYQGDRWSWPISAGDPFQVLGGEHFIGEFNFTQPRSIFVQILHPNTGEPVAKRDLQLEGPGKRIRMKTDGQGWAKITPSPEDPFHLFLFLNGERHRVGPIVPNLKVAEDRQVFTAQSSEH